VTALVGRQSELLLLQESRTSVLTVGDQSGRPELVLIIGPDAPALALSGPARGDIDVGTIQVVKHGTDEAYPRPSGALVCYWVGTVPPLNAIDGDLGSGWS
jgi:hypothetical protein